MAALHGHEDAFLCLHDLCEDGKGYEYSRRNDGETILHCAISGDYFDLAFQIIHLYENLANSVNEQGSSPLHLLAAKPSAFRSSGHLGRFNTLIYHCIFVENLEVEKSQSQSSQAKTDVKEPICPQNYETCHDLIRPMWKVFELVLSKVTKNASGGIDGGGKPVAPDAENPAEKMKTATEATQDKERNLSHTESPAEANEDHIEAQGHQLRRPIYSAPFEFVKLVCKAMLIILGLGSSNIRKLRGKKQKHTWSVQVMNELLGRTRLYEYEHDGRKPLPPPSGQEEDSQESKFYGFDSGDDDSYAVGEAFLDEIEKPVPHEASRATYLGNAN